MASKSLIIDSSHSEVSSRVKKLWILTVKGTITDFTGQFAINRMDYKPGK